jgi:apolipoprotein N-acyltransferase
MRVARGLGLAVLSGAMVVLAWPQHGFGWLILVAGVPMLVAQHHVLPARCAGLATAVTYGLGAAGLDVVGDIDPPGRTVVWGGIVAVALGAGIAGQVERWLWTRIGYRWWIAAAPLAWGVQAVVRLHLPFAGSDGFLALDLFRHPAVLQPVGVVGIVGLEMAIVLVNVVLAAVVMSLRGDERFPRPRVRRVAVGLAAGVAVWVGASLVLLDDPPPTLRVAAIQPDVRTGGWFAYAPGTSVTDPMEEKLAELTEQAADRGAQLVVWPEYGLLFDPCDPDGPLASSELPGGAAVDGAGPSPAGRAGASDAGALDGGDGDGDRGQTVPEMAESTGVHIVAGYGAVDGFDGSGRPNAEDFRARNEAVLITPEGECLGPYAKRHPVEWIGEVSDTDYGTPTFPTDLGRLATVICYDLEFTDVSRAMAAGGAQLVAAPSEDWPELARYHTAPLVFRSIENGVATVKADQHYDSAVIDPHGRIVDEVVDPGGRTAVVVADVALGDGHRTFWNRYATHLEVLWVLGAAAVAALVLRDVRRRPSITPAGRGEMS